MRIGIVGCGLNSDYHIRFARAYPNAQIVGVADRDEQKGRVCAGRQGIQGVYTSVEQLIDAQEPQVIHVVTPPATHLDVAKKALALGCNVLVEKPLTLSLLDGAELYDLAAKRGVELCAMHNHFFDPCMAKAHALVSSGMTGKIINVESYYGLNTHIDAFRKYPAPNALPWIYALPGGVFHDFISHPLYVMLPYTGRPEGVQVTEQSFGELPQNLSDELRIVIRGEHALGVMTISFAAKPHQHFLRIYGSKMVVHVNFDTMTTTCHGVSPLPKAAQKAAVNLSEGWQLLAGTVSNVWEFGTGRLKPYQGMQVLIHRFYDAIQGKGESPVSKEDALVVIKTMNEILGEVKNKHLQFDPIVPKKKETVGDDSPRILVTGATGFLGCRLVEVMIQKGYRVRCLARKLSNVESLRALDTEIYFGDVADETSLREAMNGVDVVVHAAADTAGDAEEGKRSTILGTRNVIEVAKSNQIKKLVYISTCNVYGVADCRDGDKVTEVSPLERFPEKRGAYSDAKLKAEEIVREEMGEDELPIVCLRPGTIFGPGGEVFTPMMGFSLGNKVFGIIGNGRFVLPLVYIDNLVDAIVLAIEREESKGKIYQIVDPDVPNKRQYADALLKKLYPAAKTFYIPYPLLYSAVLAQEILFRALKRNPFLTRYRLVSSQRNVLYDSKKIREELQWSPRVSIQEAFERMLRFERCGSSACECP